MELPDDLATVLNAKKVAGKLFQIGVARQRMFINDIEVNDETRIQPGQRLVMMELMKKSQLKENEEEVYEYTEEVVYEYESSSNNSGYGDYSEFTNMMDDEVVSSAASSSDEPQIPNIYDM